MNISKFSALCLLVASAAFAQATPPVAAPATAPIAAPADPQAVPKAILDSTVSSVVAPSNSPEIAVHVPPVSSSSAEAQVASESKTIFDSVRGHAYNPYGTVGAASTVKDLIKIPGDINEKKFLYVSPTDNIGYTAFPLGNSSAMLGLDNSTSPHGNLAAFVFGYATSDFGFALNYSVSKMWTSDNYTKKDTATTMPGDNIGLYFSFPIGFATFYANASWLTYYTSYSVNNDGDKMKFDYSEIQGYAGLTGKAGSLDYDGYLNVIRTGSTWIDINDEKHIDPDDSYLGVAVHFDAGYTVLQNLNARVIIGANNFVSMKFLDKIKSTNTRGDNIIGFVFSPNILGEVALTQSWLAFVGAKHSLNLIAGNGDRIKDTSILTIAHSDKTGATAGARYQKANWAVEANANADIFNNPFGGFNGNNMFYSFGGFINF